MEKKSFFSTIRFKILMISVIFLVEIIAIIVSTIRITNSQKNDGLVINLSGRQRMLTQKMTKEMLMFSFYKTNSFEQKMKETKYLLENTMKVFETTLLALKDGGSAPLDLEFKKFRVCPKPDNKAIVKQLEIVNQLWVKMKKHIQGFIISEGTNINDYNFVINNNLKLLSEMNKAVEMFQKDSEKKVNTLIRIQLLFFLVGLLIFATSIYFVNKQIIAPIDILQTVLKNAKDGDISQDIEIKKNDELGELSHSFNIFIKELRDILSNVMNLTNIINKIASDSYEENNYLSERTQKDAASVEEITATTQSIKESAESNNEKANMVNNILDQTISNANEGKKLVNETSEVMSKATESSKKVYQIVEIVNSIASQTNLLAINAAVEAARAGEVGKGFAVVASEVRNLAQQTADAVSSIQTLVEESNTYIEKSNESVNITVEKIFNIIESIQNMTAMVQDIKEGSNQQFISIKEITIGINSINTSIQENSVLVEKLLNMSEELKNISENLANQISMFKL